MREIDKAFRIQDTSIGIWRAHYNGQGSEDWETHEAVRMLLKRDGFTFQQDPHVKKNYPSIARFSHVGVKQDVHFRSRLNGRSHEVLFYEDVIRDNPNGGQYHYDKLAKMPYQRRKKTELAVRKVTDLLLSLGFTDESSHYSRSAWVQCMQRRLELEAFHGKNFYTRGPSPYNEKAADGTILRDGQFRYFWGYDGRLGRGTIMHNINNMWWVIAGPYTLQNIANFRIFDWKPNLPRLAADTVASRLKRHLKHAVENERFEQAIPLRNALRAASAEQAVAA